MKKHKLVCLLMLFVLFNASLISAAEEVKEKIIFVGYKEDPELKAYLEKEDNEKKLYQWRSLNQAIFEKSERDGSCILTIEFNGLNHIEGGDEHTYFYMGKLITEGVQPYTDFFVSRPPLQIYLISVIYKIFGFNLIALKLIPLLSV